jgi:hypothetical protein
MKKMNTAWIAAIGTVAVLTAGTGLAQTPPPRPAPAQRPAAAPTTAPSTATGASHTMEGEVTKVDAKKGWVDVKTAEGRMKLHYPPPALDSVKKGDMVTVEIGLRAAK